MEYPTESGELEPDTDEPRSTLEPQEPATDSDIEDLEDLAEELEHDSE